MVFDFRMGREREDPKRFLGNFEGILQSDGLAYDHIGGAGIVHSACWAHAIGAVRLPQLIMFGDRLRLAIQAERRYIKI